MRQRLISVACIAIVLAAACLVPARFLAAQNDPDRGRPDQAVLAIAPGQPAQAQAGAGPSVGYRSPPTQAVRPFTHLLLRREAGLPAGAGLELQLRSSADGASWTGWQSVAENDDLWSESDGADLAWSQTVAVGGLARFWQVQALVTPSAQGQLPELRQIIVDTVDASGPLPTAPPQPNAVPNAVSKPGVVSRTGWGSPDGQASRVKPYYYPVNHMVVHHTADSNTLTGSEQSWADRVRAEWAFHTYSRGWGDVGYNYLIDPNGTIYEGRAGGDDAVAFHDTANYGSMGVVLIGTYSSVPPTGAAQDALVRLLAWKASQKGIDALGSSYYYGCSISSYCRPFNAGSVVPNIAGHRGVTPGHTTCPGSQAFDILPGIRERVKRMVGGSSPESGDLVIDDLESNFARSPVSWHEATCGFDGHTYWTYASDGAPENSATWRPNIPASGRYRVYAHIPQGCGLAPPPYASTKAVYRIHSAEGDANVTVDHNTGTSWVDLGAYQFSAGTGGAVELYDNTGEPLSAGKVLFFDALKWEPDNSSTSAQITNIGFDRTSLSSGELLKVSFTVKNTGSTTLQGQAPRVDLTAGGGLGSVENGYVYDQDECFAGTGDGSYPSFPKEDDRFRVALGWSGWDDRPGNSCAGPTSGYPWRWGLNADLAPGQQQTIVGYVRFRTPGSYTLQGAVVQEYVQYYQQGVQPTGISVADERVAPVAAGYDGLAPAARVYQLGSIPDNFLARTRNPLSIPRATYLGSFAWDGAWISWGEGGPFGQSDGFLVEQTRSFYALDSGVYTFRTSSDDGSWLWVDGQEVVVNNGLHSDAAATGEIWLGAGVHILSVKYFERTGDASAGYSMRGPGAAQFAIPPDALGGGAVRFGATFAETPRLRVVADDQGGQGISFIRWSWDGQNWQDEPGALLDVGKLVSGSYTLRYRAYDAQGNPGELNSLSFGVDTALPFRRVFLPAIGT